MPMTQLTRREVLLMAAGAAAARASALPNRPETTMQKAAADFLAALTPEQRAKASFPFHSEERMNWHYVPKERRGISYKEMTSAQREAAQNLLRTGLSAKGFDRAETIRRLENVLREMEQGGAPARDPDRYYFTVFGEPSAKEAWGWRYEGHHTSFNFTVLDGRILASSPQFLGANPAEVREGPMKGTRALGPVEDLARALLKSLSEDQRGQAVLSASAPPEILTGAARKAALLENRGLAYRDMTREQQGMLIALIEEHASAQKPETARKRLDAIRRAGLDEVKFAWMGGQERGQGHYYRIQGAAFLIEYDNTQNNANHIHTVWRDFRGDWGADLLAEHYRTSLHHA
jgi:hypothetical protein